ncbi:hypothetical protein Nepgr_033646 [Nepenthes gracilis]|uniref:Uncharacterized protein n=1 Tax=Nepenthes gracilis TaxID=150966 RepID=A0AAD3TMV2_NEPGR|nr:hypothetical protein Nepgr_033646 [Nepenthes gracilis]
MPSSSPIAPGTAGVMAVQVLYHSQRCPYHLSCSNSFLLGANNATRNALVAMVLCLAAPLSRLTVPLSRSCRSLITPSSSRVTCCAPSTPLLRLIVLVSHWCLVQHLPCLPSSTGVGPVLVRYGLSCSISSFVRLKSAGVAPQECPCHVSVTPSSSLVTPMLVPCFFQQHPRRLSCFTSSIVLPSSAPRNSPVELVRR